ncbi:hypothetical protein PTKIN_Ptkin11bG0157800 [Pterospermum kingtungense]
MFTEEELKNMEGFTRGSDFIEVKCGCTSKKYGDTIGKLRVFSNGQFLISCKCTPACDEERLTPYDFEKHSGKEGTKNWKNHIWVVLNNKKVPLWRTVLLKYYKHASNGANGLSYLQGKRVFHRDEFVRCARCKKERRFRLRTEEECRNYHDASIARRWKCDNACYVFLYAIIYFYEKYEPETHHKITFQLDKFRVTLVLSDHFVSESTAMMMKRELVGEVAEAALDPQPAKVVLVVSALGASSAASWTVSAVLVLTSCKMQNLEPGTLRPICAPMLQL